MQDNEPTLGAVTKLGTLRFIYLLFIIIIIFFSVLCLSRGQVRFAHKRRLLKTQL